MANRAAWTELKWTHTSGVYIATEVKHQGRLIAKDIGDESVNAVTLRGARIGVQQQWGKARWSAFLRGDNLSGKTYAGTVIVSEANRRYFEPAAGRPWLARASSGVGSEIENGRRIESTVNVFGLMRTLPRSAIESYRQCHLGGATTFSNGLSAAMAAFVATASRACCSSSFC